MGQKPISVGEVQAKIDEFKSLVAENLRSNLEMKELYRVRSSRGDVLHWPKAYGEVWGPIDNGVYLCFDEEDHLIYVGKAWSFGYRLGAYVKYVDHPRDKSCKILSPTLDQHGLSGFRAVPLADNLRFLAPALEWFLIEKLNPPCNKQFRTNLQDPVLNNEPG